jgi:hypothetical protein
MSKEYRTVPADEVIGKLPGERRAKIKARATELIAEELGLQELRKSKQVTQEQVAERIGGKQVYVSRLEKRTDMKLSTLREYVKAIGGDLQLVVTFPEGSVRLRAGTESGRRRKGIVKKRTTVTSGAGRSSK